jgi:hypothetical protein
MGDEDDPVHRGFPANAVLVRKLHPHLVLHGHVDPQPGTSGAATSFKGAPVVNVTGHHLLELAAGGRS